MSKKNIFAKFQDYVNKPKRNVFDLSFANNITTKFGQLTPVFCKECIPGDSFKIHSRFALQMMPMKFPVQTPMRAYLHFFYVRNRTLYKDWMDFIGGTKDNLTLPYVTPTDKQKFYRVGGLADYLGVPNVVYGGLNNDGDGFGQQLSFTLTPVGGVNLTNRYPSTGDDFYTINYSPLTLPSLWLNINNLNTGVYCYSHNDSYRFYNNASLVNNTIQSISDGIEQNIRGLRLSNYLASLPSVSNQTQMNNLISDWLGYNNEYVSSQDSNSIKVAPIVQIGSLQYNQVYNDYHGSLVITYPAKVGANNQYSSVFVMCLDSEGRVKSFRAASGLNADTDTGMTATFALLDLVPSDVDKSEITEIRLFQIPYIKSQTNDTEGEFTYKVGFNNASVYPTSVNYVITEGSNISSQVIGTGNYSTTPYDSDIHLNALPFRAYEAIYNSYYRNPQNNPYVLDNTPEYNKYIPSYDGGADANEYDLHQRNWEYDFLTSAVQTPQQGDIAPLVGISVTGEATFQDENGNTYYASAQYDSNGNITGWTSHSPNMPQGSLRLLMDMAGTGISINDLRNVNAFQKFLENNIRRGLKYRDQIKSHFGVDVRYDELDMPEFIGGCSTDVSINKLSQTSESGDTPLGSFVGQASAYGESKHDITHYCDEHGFIIGIMSIVPVPVYSQLLPKFFLKSEQLDYYFPEFGHIGYQPILQKEVSPLQTYYNGGNLNKVFGYQRSWYDYLDSTDEVHGQFRTTMRDFLMNRTFSDEPELSKEFLLVDPDQLNDVFLAGTDDNDIYAPEADKIIGSLYFNVSKKSPIPLFGIPRLD